MRNGDDDKPLDFGGTFPIGLFFLANQKRPVRTGWVWEYRNMTLLATVIFLGFSLALFKCGVFQSCWLLGSMDWVQRNSIGNLGKPSKYGGFHGFSPHFFSAKFGNSNGYHFSKWVISPAANPGPKKTGSSEQVTLRHVLHLIDIEQGSGPHWLSLRTDRSKSLVRSLNRSTLSRLSHLETGKIPVEGDFWCLYVYIYIYISYIDLYLPGWLPKHPTPYIIKYA